MEKQDLEYLKRQLEIADAQIKRLIKTERRLLNLEEKMQRVLKRYKALQEISQFILTTREIEKIFNFVCEKFVSEMEVERVVFLLKEKEFLAVKNLGGYPRKEAEALRGKKFSLDFPIIKEIVEKGTLIVMPNEKIDPGFEEEFKMSNLIGFAIYGEKKSLLGIFLMGTSAEKLNIFPLLTQEDIVVFIPLMTQLGTSIELFHLLRTMEEKIAQKTLELRKRVKELEYFTKVAIGRELKIIELKKEIKQLKEQLENCKKNLV